MNALRAVLAACPLALAASACGVRPPASPRILVAPKGLVHSFWVAVRRGAEEAGREFGARILWRGPAQETDVATQIAIVEDAIAQRLDGIVIAACDRQALVPVVERAAREGIPIVAIDSGLDSEVPRSLVATDNLEASREAARALGRLLGGRGEVACVPFVPGAQTSNEREQGFREGLAEFPEVELVAVRYSQSEVARAMAVTEDLLVAHRALAGIFAANEAGAIGVVQALRARGEAGRVKVVAFDAAKSEVEAIRQGAIDALVVQDPWRMGYLGVKTVLDARAGRPVERRVDTGVRIVTRENLDDPEIRALLERGG